MDTFPIDEQDIAFVLFEQLGIDSLFEFERFRSLCRDDVEMVLGEAYRFMRNELWPLNVIGDREGCTFDQGSVKVPASFHAVYRMFAENGWISLTSSEEMGGAGMPITVGIAVTETLIGANVGFSLYPGLTRGAARVINRFGDDWFREVFGKRLLRGEWCGTMCLTEAQAGTAVGDIRTTAVKKGADYFITGNKLFVSAGEHDLAPNIVHLVLARCADAPKGVKGLSLFVVPKIWVERDGSLGEANDVVCTGVEEKMGLHGSATCALSFGENGGCRGRLLGAEGEGMKLMFLLMNMARIGAGLHGLSLASVAYQHALDYAKERIQGVEILNMADPDAPRVPIIKHPDVKRMLFTMKALVEGMRALLLRASFYMDLSDYHPDEEARAKYGKLLEFLTPVCKAYCSDKGFDVTVMALQCFGGYGYISEFPMEQLVRDAKIASVYEGTNGIQALDLVGRKLTKNHGEYFMLAMAEIAGVIEANKAHAELGALAGRLEEELGRVQAVTGNFAEEGMKGNVFHPIHNATPYLAMTGNLLLGWVLLEQARIAHDGLAALPSGQETQARFYEEKVATAKFFIRNLLPMNAGIAASILEGSQEYLQTEI